MEKRDYGLLPCSRPSACASFLDLDQNTDAERNIIWLKFSM